MRLMRLMRRADRAIVDLRGLGRGQRLLYFVDITRPGELITQHSGVGCTLSPQCPGVNARNHTDLPTPTLTILVAMRRYASRGAL